MLSQIILVIFYFSTPFLILYLCHTYRFVNKLGAVVLAYIVGLIAGNVGILPENSIKVQEMINMVTIPIAIPLLLFSSDMKNWFSMAGKTITSMFVAIGGVVIMVFLGYVLFHEEGTKELWKIGGMLIGVYTGGTPNLASLKIMLKVDADTYILTHTYDMILSSFYLFFLISIGKNVFRRFLPDFPGRKNGSLKISDLNGTDPYGGILKKRTFFPLMKALGLAILIFGIAGSTTLVVPEALQMVVVILLITSLGIVFSFARGIQKIEKTFELGMYFILVFSVNVASMANIQHFMGLTPKLFSYITLVVFGSLFFHVWISKLLKIDTDTVMITSTALICSPPFVPVVAGAIKNREIVVSGLTVGIIGYAIGNYLGFFVAQILKTIA